MHVFEILATLGYPVQRRALTDATFARVIEVPECVSGLKHVQTKYLWVLQKVKDNAADVGTQYMKGEEVRRMSDWINLRDEGENVQVVDGREAKAIAIGRAMVPSNRRLAILSCTRQQQLRVSRRPKKSQQQQCCTSPGLEKDKP